MESQEQSVKEAMRVIFEAIDNHGPAMQQRVIRDALNDLYVVAQTNA